MKTRTISVKGSEITVSRKEQEDYISLTDIAKYRNNAEPFAIINNWMRSRSTIELLGLWEGLSNPDFKPLEFERFRSEAGSNYFVLSPQRWIEATNAIGLVSRSGRYGGTFAHADIAFEFASWISVEFKLYLIKEFQRLKQEEFDQKKLEWSVSRTIAKVNYLIHTDAIKENLIPPDLQISKNKFIYADEADLLNLALFGQTALDWKTAHPELKGNMRDYASLEQLVVLSNLESFNAELIKMGIPSEDRLQKLNKTAIGQMKVLVANRSMTALRQEDYKLSGISETTIVEGKG
jgi:hypothetical protein